MAWRAVQEPAPLTSEPGGAASVDGTHSRGGGPFRPWSPEQVLEFR